MPLYNQIQKYITEQIESGRWGQGHRLPSERQLAEQFQVSRITAKNAVLGLVADGYLYRHRGKGTFVSDEAKPRERGSESQAYRDKSKSGRTIGMIIPWVEYNYCSMLIMGAEHELSKLGYHLLLKLIPHSETAEAETVRELLDYPVDGLIMVASRGEYFQDELIRLVLNGFPLVFIEKYMRDYKANGVSCDTEKVGYLMGQYLTGRGLAKIGVVSYPIQFTVGVKERIFGFQSALVENGVPPVSPERFLTVSTEMMCGVDQLESGRSAPEEIVSYVRDNPGLEAIATVDALTARYVGKACAQAGRYDIVIVCCDQPTCYPDCVAPAAYVDQSPAELGVQAARLIAASMSDSAGEKQHITLSPKLVELNKYH